MFLWETAIIVCISLALIAFIILNFNEKIEELIQTPVGELFSLQNIWAPALVVLFLFPWLFALLKWGIVLAFGLIMAGLLLWFYLC